ncbi:MAG: FtsX-like permease family protein [Bacteroidia bacterium]
MRFVNFVAFRYLFAPKRTNFINLVTGISFLGVWVGAAALVVVLSVYNGLEALTEGLYSKFNPDIRIRPATGKLLNAQELEQALQGWEQVEAISYSLQENALVRYGEREQVAMVKGVDSAYAGVTGIASTMIRGEFVLRDGFGLPYAMLGSGLGYALQISLNDFRRGLDVYMPLRGAKIDLMRPERAFVQRSLQPAGIFDVQPDINQHYMLVPLVFMQNLMQLNSEEVGEAELLLKPGVQSESFMKRLQQHLGDDFEVKDRYRQEEAIYKIFRTEKWWTYFFLLLIVLVAALNLVGSLSMLVIEKKRDIAILAGLGASRSQLFAIFMGVGLLITGIGALLGVGTGVLLCWLQQNFGFIQLAGEGSFVVNAYPVRLLAFDIVAVLLGVCLIGALCALYPAQRAARQGLVKA